MIAWRAPLVVVIAGALAVACNTANNAQRGGEPERQLVAATVAGDVARVNQLLASGADPNKMAPHEGHNQSAWKLALHQVRPQRRELVDIVRAMLRAHANPDVAWGEAPSRRGGYAALPVTPLLEALPYDVPDVARALFEAGLSPRRGQLALVLAVENRQTEMVHVLVEAGVDVNSRPSANTPLVAAIEARDVALMTYLEEHGAREKP
jgi:ankyrin repeat protein